jgi:hypothetical protein
VNVHPEIAVLSRHLRTNLQSLRGKTQGARQHFNPSLLIPLAALVGVTALLSISPKARKSLLVKVAMLVSTHLLQEHNEELDDEQTGARRYDPRQD